MQKHSKRIIRFPNQAKGNPSVRLHLSEADLRYGIIVEIELDGAVKRLEFEPRHMCWISLLTCHHRNAERRGTLNFKPMTYPTFKDFLGQVSRDRKAPGLYFKPPSKHHEQALAYVCYAFLPPWAKKETAFRERWGDSEFSFHGGGSWNPDEGRIAA